MRKAKTAFEVFAGQGYWATLDIPSRMPRSREKVREAARAMLSAWDEHSIDPKWGLYGFERRGEGMMGFRIDDFGFMIGGREIDPMKISEFDKGD